MYIINWWKVMSLFAYSGSPTRSSIGRAQVMLSVDEIAREKSAFGTNSFGEESEGEPMLSTVAE
jgi:hypothetical protein